MKNISIQKWRWALNVKTGIERRRGIGHKGGNWRQTQNWIGRDRIINLNVII